MYISLDYFNFYTIFMKKIVNSFLASLVAATWLSASSPETHSWWLEAFLLSDMSWKILDTTKQSTKDVVNWTTWENSSEKSTKDIVESIRNDAILSVPKKDNINVLFYGYWENIGDESAKSTSWMWIKATWKTYEFDLKTSKKKHSASLINVFEWENWKYLKTGLSVVSFQDEIIEWEKKNLTQTTAWVAVGKTSRVELSHESKIKEKKVIEDWVEKTKKFKTVTELNFDYNIEAFAWFHNLHWAWRADGNAPFYWAEAIAKTDMTKNWALEASISYWNTRVYWNNHDVLNASIAHYINKDFKYWFEYSSFDQSKNNYYIWAGLSIDIEKWSDTDTWKFSPFLKLTHNTTKNIKGSIEYKKGLYDSKLNTLYAFENKIKTWENIHKKYEPDEYKLRTTKEVKDIKPTIWETTLISKTETSINVKPASVNDKNGVRNTLVEIYTDAWLTNLLSINENWNFSDLNAETDYYIVTSSETLNDETKKYEVIKSDVLKVKTDAVVVEAWVPPVMWDVSNITVENNWAVNINASSVTTKTNWDDILEYTLSGTLPTWLNFDENTWVVSWNSTIAWTYNFGITAKDKDGVSNTDNFSITINSVAVVVDNIAPPAPTWLSINSWDATTDSQSVVLNNLNYAWEPISWRFVSESSIKPWNNDWAWSWTKPSSYILSGWLWVKTIYIYVKDAAWNVSDYVSDSIEYITPIVLDPVPNAFDFTDLSSQETNSEVTSWSTTIAWTNTSSPISISNWEYSVNNWPFVSWNWSVNLWDTVVLKQTTSSNYSTTVATTVTIGWVSDTFRTTTKAEPISVLTQAPSTPDLNDGDDSWISSTDNITNNNNVSVSYGAVAWATWYKISINGWVYTDVWNILTTSITLPEWPTNDVKVLAYNTAWDGPASSGLSVNVDNTAPTRTSWWTLTLNENEVANYVQSFSETLGNTVNTANTWTINSISISGSSLTTNYTAPATEWTVANAISTTISDVAWNVANFTTSLTTNHVNIAPVLNSVSVSGITVSNEWWDDYSIWKDTPRDITFLLNWSDDEWDSLQTDINWTLYSGTSVTFSLTLAVLEIATFTVKSYDWEDYSNEKLIRFFWR